MNGYIRLYRSILDWEWHADPNTLSVFVHLLLGANYTDKRWRGRELHAGQIVTSISSLAKKTGMSVRSVRTSLNHLKSTGEVTSETTNEYSVITIVNWAKYQSQEDQIDKRPTSETTGDRQATDKRPTSDRQQRNKGIREEGKKENNVVTKESASRFAPPTVEEVTEYCNERKNNVCPQTFVDFYASKGWKVGANAMKDWRACVRTWEKRDNNVNAIFPPPSRAAPPGQKPHYNPFLDMLKEAGET